MIGDDRPRVVWVVWHNPFVLGAEARLGGLLETSTGVVFVPHPDLPDASIVGADAARFLAIVLRDLAVVEALEVPAAVGPCVYGRPPVRVPTHDGAARDRVVVDLRRDSFEAMRPTAAAPGARVAFFRRELAALRDWAARHSTESGLPFDEAEAWFGIATHADAVLAWDAVGGRVAGPDAPFARCLDALATRAREERQAALGPTDDNFAQVYHDAVARGFDEAAAIVRDVFARAGAGVAVVDPGAPAAEGLTAPERPKRDV